MNDAVRYVAKNMRLDLRLISEMVAPGSRVLDIGCGDGTLIEHLYRTHGCDARGIEIDMAEVTRAIAHGLPVMHGDADSDLAQYPDGAFDYVVLSRTLQAVERPREVLRQMLRIGRHALVSNRVANSISQIDFIDWKVVAQLPGPSGPDCMDITADGQLILVASRWSRKLSVIDIASRKLVRQVPVGKSPHGVWTLDHAPRN